VCQALTGEAWIECARHRNPRGKHRCWVAAAEGHVVGWGFCGQHVFNYEPGRFTIAVVVRVQHRRRGMGAALHDRLGFIAEPDSVQLGKGLGSGDV